MFGGRGIKPMHRHTARWLEEGKFQRIGQIIQNADRPLPHIAKLRVESMRAGEACVRPKPDHLGPRLTRMGFRRA